MLDEIADTKTTREEERRETLKKMTTPIGVNVVTVPSHAMPIPNFSQSRNQMGPKFADSIHCQGVGGNGVG
jgi:hypothetical protein